MTLNSVFASAARAIPTLEQLSRTLKLKQLRAQDAAQPNANIKKVVQSAIQKDPLVVPYKEYWMGGAAHYYSIQGNYPKPRENFNKPTLVAGTNITVSMMASAQALATLLNASFIIATDLNKIAEDIMSMFSPIVDQELFLDADLGSILKDRLGKKLKPDVIAYYEKMETAFLSESALSKDWLTPEEDEAWKDL
jgi:hypothetical protein